LPDPELNPLLNPLLAAHMGRWAEVYFTNPPEKRGQAISELLRELENSSPPEPVPVQRSNMEYAYKNVEDEVEEDHAEAAPTPDSFVAAVELPLTCGSCGYNNSARQRFCGMCGSPLGISPAHPPQVAEAAPQAAVSWGELDRALEGSLSGPGVASDSDSVDIGHPQTAHSAPWPLPEENLPDLGVPQFQSEFTSAPRSYRIYIGAVLAILLVLMVYMTWRGSAAFWGGVTAPAQVPRAVPAGQPASPTLAQPTPVQSVAPTSAPPTPPVRSQRQPDADSPRDAALDTRPTPRIVSVTASSSTLAAAQGGFEELATAEKYLNAGTGTTPDTQEAARWLWKAVAKENSTATLLLSDLYLRGDGVPKSCDQARLLLDAAARKGATAAAERLRNLQAFGCQ
jgi:hypothetical protein